jgi:hypothetical protein
MPRLASRFWADVVGNSGTSLTPRLRTASNAPSRRSVSLSHGRSSSLHSQNIVTRRGRSPPKRSLATHVERSFEDEAFHDVLSRAHGLHPSMGHEISVYDESLRAASPLRSPLPGPPSPRFDWRLRATSRAAARSGSLQPSNDRTDSRTYIKRVVPQHLDIQQGERFHHEVKAYEER